MAWSGVEPRDGRHDAGGVAGEEDHVLRMAGALVGHGVRDEVERVGAARVLGDLLVVEVEDARDRIVDDVLEDRPESPRGGVDLRLGVRREADHLRVAAVLEVEDAVVAPAVLVVADEAALRVGAEASSCRCRRGRRRWPRRRHCPTFAEQCIDSTPSSRQQVVEDGEDRLLDLAARSRCRR